MSILFWGCGTEPEESVRHKFDLIITDDMAAITEGLPSESILEKPYTNLLDWEKYEEGQFHYRAVVEFYFYSSIPKKIIRKYRYNASAKKWERYYNQYHSLRGSLSQDVKPLNADSVKNIIE